MLRWIKAVNTHAARVAEAAVPAPVRDVVVGPHGAALACSVCGSLTRQGALVQPRKQACVGAPGLWVYMAHSPTETALGCLVTPRPGPRRRTPPTSAAQSTASACVRTIRGVRTLAAVAAIQSQAGWQATVRSLPFNVVGLGSPLIAGSHALQTREQSCHRMLSAAVRTDRERHDCAGGLCQGCVA